MCTRAPLPARSNHRRLTNPYPTARQELTPQGDVSSRPQVAAAAELGQALVPLRHRDGGSVASSSPGESPRRQRTLGPTAFTEGDAGDAGDAGLSVRDEGRRSSSDSSRASISDPARIKRTTSITRGPLAASWRVMGSETAYPSEPLLPPPAALTPRATALASALESLLHRG